MSTITLTSTSIIGINGTTSSSTTTLSGLFKEAYSDTIWNINRPPEFKTNLEKEHWELENMGYKENRYEYRWGMYSNTIQPRRGYTFTAPTSGTYAVTTSNTTSTITASTNAILTVSGIDTVNKTVTIKSNP